MARCKACNAPITWELTTKGKRIPLDLAPTDDGNVTIEGGRAVVHAQPPLDVEAGRRYLSHFVTCPKASEFRR